MVRLAFTCLLAAAPALAVAAPSDDYEEFDLSAQSLRGPTGYITSPSARVGDYREGSIALHKFVLGLLYGWPRNIEFGTSFDLRDVTPITPFTRDTYRERAPHVNLHGKIQILHAERHWLDGAAGFVRHRHIYYFALSPPPYRGLRLNGGPEYERRSNGTHTAGFFSALVFSWSVQQLMLDFDSVDKEAALGWRYLLSDSIRLDLFLTRMGKAADFFDRVLFGISIAG